MNQTTTESAALWRIISHVCALAVGGYFIYAAWSKIGPENVRQFAIQIGNYKIIDPAYVNIPAIILPFVEIFAALALIVPATRKSGAIVIIGLLLFFIVALYYAAIVLGLEITCGCSGKGSGKAGWQTIGSDVAMVVATIVSVALCRSKRPATETVAEGA